MQLGKEQKKLSLLILSIAFFFIIPIRLFIIGDGGGWGVQGINYVYQVTSYGMSFIPINNLIGYVLFGNITGITAYSIIFNAIGSFLFVLWFILILIPGKRTVTNRRYLLILCSIVAYIIGDVIQYGPFIGPAGIVIPLYIAEFIGLSWFDYILHQDLKGRPS